MKKKEYTSYDTAKYRREYVDESTGGYLVIDRRRIVQGSINKQEIEKFEKERDMCIVLAKNGYTVEYLEDRQGSYDIYLNGIPADLKSTSSHNNMVKYARKATREQGAKIVVFEFEKETDMMHAEIRRLQSKAIRGKYYFSRKKDIVYDF